MTEDGDGHLKGAEQLAELRDFSKGSNFVDLHLDFPASFEHYVMGLTPFMRAVQRIGHENYLFHKQRLNALNQLYPLAPDLSRVIRLHSRNSDLFTRLCESKFGETVKSAEPQDLDAALYCVIAKVFFAFSLPNDNADAVHTYTQILQNLAGNDKRALDALIQELVDSRFLANIRTDCLEIYPRILGAELPLRPALFLDFDPDYKTEVTSFRVSIDDFQMHRDLYKDISEILSRQLVLVAGINNLLHRRDHDRFDVSKKNAPKDLQKYADVPFGLKSQFLDDSWYELEPGVADNQLRNSIAHYKAEYDEVTQVITYYPRKEGMRQEESASLTFLDFMRKLLMSYREMHRLHQLVKCLQYYCYFLYQAHE